MTTRSKLRRTLSEYFLGTDTREFYNRQIGMIDGFIEDEQSRNKHVDSLVYARNSFVRGKYLSNVLDIISMGSLTGYLFTGDELLLVYGTLGIVNSELFRNSMSRTDRSRRKMWELCSDLARFSFDIRERLNGLNEKLSEGDDGIDTSGYDGWYLPEGDD